MKIALEDANKSLRPIIRSIDKRIDYVTALTEGDRPGVALTISRREKTKTVEIPLPALVAAADDATKRYELRNRIKRAYDRMMFVPCQMVSTKMLRGSTSADGFFRPQGGYRR